MIYEYKVFVEVDLKDPKCVSQDAIANRLAEGPQWLDGVRHVAIVHVRETIHPEHQSEEAHGDD